MVICFRSASLYICCTENQYSVCSDHSYENQYHLQLDVLKGKMWKSWIFPSTTESWSSRFGDICSQNILLAQNTALSSMQEVSVFLSLYMSYDEVRNPNRFESDWGRQVLSSDDPTTVTQSLTGPNQCLSKVFGRAF